eukprot:gene14581-17687_t
MLRELSSFIRRGSKDVKEDFFVIPICSGTSAIDIHYVLTETNSKMVNLNPLNYKYAQQLLRDIYPDSADTLLSQPLFKI